MYEIMIIIWFTLFILTTILEFITLDLVSIWFAIASLITLIVSFFPKVSWEIQVSIFLILTIIFLFITRPIVKKYFTKNIKKTNIDAYIGKTAIVISDIDPLTGGIVKFNSLEWTAISDSYIKKNSLVTILKIEGVKLIVKEKEI